MEKARIRIASDDAAIAPTLTAFQDRDGFRRVCASDGAIALMHHRALRPDLVLRDVQMPKRDGFDALAEIRRRGRPPARGRTLTSILTHDRD
ncbi:response regulator [Sphingomonas sp.]|uniref:response regulator n=1 Tax=Sphingomonas sp. TaxID=28214 RepID=UPI0033401CD0